ncbi:MAG: RNA 2',3'-cyclic phosphodiesterase [Thermoplasmata archaeon]
MRLFFAVPLPPLPPWSGARPPPPPAADAPPHLTLRFLGEVDPARRGALESAGRSAARRVAPFPAVLAPIGAFPSARDPRIVWIGVEEGRPTLARLAEGLQAALGKEGFPPDPRPFVPHATWRRIRSAADRARAAEWLARGRLAAPIRAPIGRLELVESRLSPGGALHTTLATFPLGEREGGA